jgi:DNA-binding CsgD family transcriptional regulator
MPSVTDAMIGREAELAAAVEVLDGPIDGLRVLLIEGEAGIGKSTLWEQAIEAARQRSCTVLVSRPAESEQALANVVLGDLLGGVTPAMLADLPVPRRRAIDAVLLREEPTDPIDPRAVGVAILTLLPVLGHGRPLVIAIDDDQWLDASSASSLRFALARSIGQPILLLLSRRDGADPIVALDAIADPRTVAHIRLGPLSLGAIQTLVRTRLGAGYPRRSLVRLHETSGGNPFHALEIASAEALDPRGSPTRPPRIPASLEALVATRLNVLEEPTRRVLLLVAAHGRLPLSLLRRLDVVPESLDRAEASNIIETADGRAAFTHPLFGSAIYHGATPSERRTAHRRLADVLTDTVDRGRHLAQATDEPDADVAAELEAASRAASRRGVPIAAAELAGQAVRLTPDDGVADRHRRAILAGRAHLASGDGGWAREIADQLVLHAPPGPFRAEALHLRADLEDPADAVPLLHEALSDATGEHWLEARIHCALAGTESATKARDEAEQHAAAAYRLAEELDSAELRVSALSVGAFLRFERGDPAALHDAEAVYRMALDLGDLVALEESTWNLGWILTSSGDYGRARGWLEHRLADWRDRDEQMRVAILWMLGQVEVWTGRWATATAYAQEVTEVGLQYGEAAPDHLLPALLALHRGQLDLARKHSLRASELVRGHLLPQHMAILGLCDLWSGSLDPAFALLRQAEAAAMSRGWSHPNLHWWRAEYIECLLQLGRSDDAMAVVADWEQSGTRLGSERVVAHVVRSRGLIAAAAGDIGSAAALLDDAVARLDAVDDPFGRGRAMLQLGVVRLRLREKRAARDVLESSLSTFEQLGAEGWAARARGELTRIGGRTRLEGLSPSEARVASLVAEGRTNREIAAALFLGEATVASHLSHIYAKLGIRSRTELARLYRPDESPSPSA